jgi:FemAB-related protein (PEP-CTERM system-associated)
VAKINWGRVSDPMIAALSGSLPNAPGSAGGYLPEWGKEIKVKHVELRNAYPEQCLGFSRLTRYVTFTQRIGPDEEAVLESIPRKTRYMVRKALKSDLSTRIQTTGLGAFEELYSRNLRKLGTPSFPSRHFQRLMANFREMIDVREVVSGEQVVAAVMTFYFRDHLFPYYGASDPSYNAKGPNNFMYYDLMRWGGRNGYQTFDFGRSKKEGSGSYDFKAHWGMMERELPYEILLINRKSLPNYSPTNPRFQLTIKLWQHLPLRVTRALGPALIRLVP